MHEPQYKIATFLKVYLEHLYRCPQVYFQEVPNQLIHNHQQKLMLKNQHQVQFLELKITRLLYLDLVDEKLDQA